MSAHKPLDDLAIATLQPVAAPSPIPALRRVRPGLITDWHLGLLAIIYVRQSTPQQILDHRESRERQYELVNYALALGWPRDRILIVDEDRGLTGTTLTAVADFWGFAGSAFVFWGVAGSAFVFCFRSCRYPPDGNECAIKVMLQDQRGTHTRS